MVQVLLPPATQIQGHWPLENVAKSMQCLDLSTKSISSRIKTKGAVRPSGGHQRKFLKILKIARPTAKFQAKETRTSNHLKRKRRSLMKTRRMALNALEQRKRRAGSPSPVTQKTSCAGSDGFAPMLRCPLVASPHQPISFVQMAAAVALSAQLEARASSWVLVVEAFRLAIHHLCRSSGSFHRTCQGDSAEVRPASLSKHQCP
jgi:hypothetical protein